MAAKGKVKTRFLLLSDTHAYWPQRTNNEPLPKVDVLIHCGDLTVTGKIHEHEAAIALIESVEAHLKIVIPGNHDLTLDTQYYQDLGHLYGPRPKYSAQQLQQIRELYVGTDAKAAGIHYLEEGIQTFKLTNGANLTICASAYTPEFCQWSFAYPIEIDRFNSPNAANPAPDFTSQPSHLPNSPKNIDIFITHGPPHTILDMTSPSHGGQNVGCPHLMSAVSRSRPLLHCFGHIHEGWGYVRKSWPSLSISRSQLQSKPRSAMTPYNELKSRQRSDAAWDDPRTLYSSAQQTATVAGSGTPADAYVDGTSIVRGEQTVFINASIMDVRYRPIQRPWVVDLLLDRPTAEDEV